MKKRTRTYLLIIIALLSVCPHTASFADTGTTEVTATVNPVYSFSVPPDTVIPYKQTDTFLGQFKVNDILLGDGEVLTLEVTAGPLRRGSGSELPYTLEFTPPQIITEADIGRTFDASVQIALDDFLAAKSGTYKGTLTFSIISSLTDSVVWSGETELTVKKPGAVQKPPPLKNPTITVFIEGEKGGKVMYEGYSLPSGAVVTTVPNGTVTFTLVPDKGYKTGKVMLNGMDVTHRIWPNGWLIIANIHSDCVLEVSFIRSASTPKTGSDTLLPLAAGCVICAGILSTLIVRRRREENGDIEKLK